MRLPSLVALIAPVALLLTACGEPDEGGAFNNIPDEETEEGEASTSMTAGPDMMDGSSSSSTTGSTSDSSTTGGTTDMTTTGGTTTGSSGNCGNGTVDMGEQCDGGNLNGFSCVDLGFSGGTLACDPVTCTYDSSNCTTSVPTTG